MLIRAPFEHGSTFIGSREIYISNWLCNVSDEIGNELLKRGGYNRIDQNKLVEEPKIKKVFPSILPELFIDKNKLMINILMKIRTDIEVSIVIPTKNRIENLKNCINSIYDNTKEITYEIVVVDSSNGDESWNFLKDHTPVIAIRDLLNMGVTRAFNVGFGYSMGEYIVWLNDDVLVEKNWLKIALNLMKKNKNAGLGAIFHKEGALAGARPPIGYIYDGDYVVRTMTPNTIHPGRSYANFGIIKQDLLKQLGYFDEGYKCYCCDTDLSHRVWMSGKDVIPLFGSKVVHLYKIDENRVKNVELYELDLKKYRSIWSKS